MELLSSRRESPVNSVVIGQLLEPFNPDVDDMANNQQGGKQQSPDKKQG
jgi:hypothetical protein